MTHITNRRQLLDMAMRGEIELVACPQKKGGVVMQYIPIIDIKTEGWKTVRKRILADFPDTVDTIRMGTRWL